MNEEIKEETIVEKIKEVEQPIIEPPKKSKTPLIIIGISLLAIALIVGGLLFVGKSNEPIIIKMSQIRKECAYASDCDIAPIINKKYETDIKTLPYVLNQLTYVYDGETIIIEDDVKPLITYEGDKKLDLNTELNLDNIKITDYGFKDISITSKSVDINTGGFDATKEAIYTITVTASDTTGNKTIENFKVEVLDRYFTLSEYKTLLNNGQFYKDSVLTQMPTLDNFSIDDKNIITFNVEGVTYQVDFTISTIRAGDFLYRLYPGTLKLGAIDYNGYRFDDETTLSTGKPVVENIQTIIKMHTSLDIEDFMGAQDPGSYVIDRITMEGKQDTKEE